MQLLCILPALFVVPETWAEQASVSSCLFVCRWCLTAEREAVCVWQEDSVVARARSRPPATQRPMPSVGLRLIPVETWSVLKTSCRYLYSEHKGLWFLHLTFFHSTLLHTEDLAILVTSIVAGNDALVFKLPFRCTHFVFVLSLVELQACCVRQHVQQQATAKCFSGSHQSVCMSVSDCLSSAYLERSRGSWLTQICWKVAIRQGGPKPGILRGILWTWKTHGILREFCGTSGKNDNK